MQDAEGERDEPAAPCPAQLQGESLGWHSCSNGFSTQEGAPQGQVRLCQCGVRARGDEPVRYGVAAGGDGDGGTANARLRAFYFIINKTRARFHLQPPPAPAQAPASQPLRTF
ncbi:hypothetical protein J6590_065792 [Homalodisca vitripennis]|nr:hypothetical protein J6590_065792 [Homalodisca vitripennis]